MQMHRSSREAGASSDSRRDRPGRIHSASDLWIIGKVFRDDDQHALTIEDLRLTFDTYASGLLHLLDARLGNLSLTRTPEVYRK